MAPTFHHRFSLMRLLSIIIKKQSALPKTNIWHSRPQFFALFVTSKLSRIPAMTLVIF